MGLGTIRFLLSQGTSNTYNRWFSSQSNDSHDLADLTTTVHRYLISMHDALEDSEPELRGSSVTCGYDTSCNCADCAHNEVYDSSIDFTKATYTAVGTSSYSDRRTEECLSTIVGNTCAALPPELIPGPGPTCRRTRVA